MTLLVVINGCTPSTLNHLTIIQRRYSTPPPLVPTAAAATFPLPSRYPKSNNVRPQLHPTWYRTANVGDRSNITSLRRRGFVFPSAALRRQSRLPVNIRHLVHTLAFLQQPLSIPSFNIVHLLSTHFSFSRQPSWRSQRTHCLLLHQTPSGRKKTFRRSKSSSEMLAKRRDLIGRKAGR